MAGATTSTIHQEQVMRIPAPVFFMPLVFATLITYLFERVIHLESFVKRIICMKDPDDEIAHDYQPLALVAFSIFCMELLQRWLSGRINHARDTYKVPVPTLYLAKSDGNPNYNEYNSYQRCHHNFLETYPQLLVGTYFTAITVERPYTAGFVLLVIVILRVFYSMGYTSNVKGRGGYFLGIIILGEVLTIYTLSAATPTLFNFHIFGI